MANYPEQVGAYKAMSRMFAKAAVELEQADSELSTELAMLQLSILVKQLKNIDAEFSTEEA